MPSRAVAGIDLHNPPAVLIRTFWEVYKETFDYLYLREAPDFLGLTLHCHFGGRLLICPVTWNGELARWTLDEKIEAETHARRLRLSQPGALSHEYHMSRRSDRRRAAPGA